MKDITAQRCSTRIDLGAFVPELRGAATALS